MALIVKFTVPTFKFALFNTLTAVPDTTLELGRVITATPESITVYVWVHASDFAVLEAAFEDDPSVTSFTVSSKTADERFYHMTWNEPIDLLVHIMTEQEGTIIHAANRTNTWAPHVSFPERDALAPAQELKELAQQNEFSLGSSSLLIDSERAFLVRSIGQSRISPGQRDRIWSDLSTFERSRQAGSVEKVSTTSAQKGYN